LQVYLNAVDKVITKVGDEDGKWDSKTTEQLQRVVSNQCLGQAGSSDPVDGYDGRGNPIIFTTGLASNLEWCIAKKKLAEPHVDQHQWSSLAAAVPGANAASTDQFGRGAYPHGDVPSISPYIDSSNARALQKYLNDIGPDGSATVGIDGKWGPKTTEKLASVLDFTCGTHFYDGSKIDGDAPFGLKADFSIDLSSALLTCVKAGKFVAQPTSASTMAAIRQAEAKAAEYANQAQDKLKQVTKDEGAAKTATNQAAAAFALCGICHDHRGSSACSGRRGVRGQRGRLDEHRRRHTQERHLHPLVQRPHPGLGREDTCCSG